MNCYTVKKERKTERSLSVTERIVSNFKRKTRNKVLISGISIGYSDLKAKPVFDSATGSHPPGPNQSM